jgi:hypothetical protein
MASSPISTCVEVLTSRKAGTMAYVEGITEADIRQTAVDRASECGCGDVETHYAEASDDYTE